MISKSYRHRSLLSVEKLCVALLGLTMMLSAEAHAANVYAVVNLPGQEGQTIHVDGPSVTLVNQGGWICNGILSSTPGKASAICRYNNAPQASTTYINCGHEKMQTANLHLMENLTLKASITMICSD